MTETAVGASVCASGSHVWNGNIGSFTAKAMKMKPKIIQSGSRPEPMVLCCRRTISNVCTGSALNPMTRKPTSMNAEPAMV